MPEIKTIDPSLVTRIVRSYVARNAIAPGELPSLITTVHRSLTDLGAPLPQPASTPAVAINRSYGRDFVVCLDCGWRGVTLRRHLTTSHSLSPAEYRSKWRLKDTHPIVAPAYADRRSTLAKQFDLGHKGRARAEAPEPVALPTAATTADFDPAFSASLATRARRPRRAAT
jgi:predicted transcriptional regulator